MALLCASKQNSRFGSQVTEARTLPFLVSSLSFQVHPAEESFKTQSRDSLDQDTLLARQRPRIIQPEQTVVAGFNQVATTEEEAMSSEVSVSRFRKSTPRGHKRPN